MNNLTVEKYLPYIIALAALLIWKILDVHMPKETSILASSLTIGAILTGFLATSKAILMTLDSPVMQRLRDTSYITQLVSYLRQAIWLSFSFCIISLVGFFGLHEQVWYGYIWLFLGVSAAIAFIQITNVMLQTISHKQ